MILLTKIITLTILTLLVPLYSLWVYKHNNNTIPHSISDSYYILKGNKRHLFTLFCYILMGGMITISIDTHLLFFLSACGFAFVGTATEFKRTNTPTDEVHYLGAVVGIGASLIGLGLQYSIWFPLLGVLLGTPLLYLLFKEKDTYIFWIEILAFIYIMIGLWVTWI